MTSRLKQTLTYRVELPGGQGRLREMILFVAERCMAAPRFGAIKLNKILWRSDFDAFAARGVPVTGRPYQRLELGPAPVEMVPLRDEMLQQGLIATERVIIADVVEHRTIALAKPNLRHFSEDDLQFVVETILYYWNKTGTEASDDSHGVAWSTRANNEPMPYELAHLSDNSLTGSQAASILDQAERKGWHSR